MILLLLAFLPALWKFIYCLTAYLPFSYHTTSFIISAFLFAVFFLFHLEYLSQYFFYSWFCGAELFYSLSVNLSLSLSLFSSSSNLWIQMMSCQVVFFVIGIFSSFLHFDKLFLIFFFSFCSAWIISTTLSFNLLI